MGTRTKTRQRACFVPRGDVCHEDADAVWPSESDDDDDGDSLNASFREPAAGSEGDSDE